MKLASPYINMTIEAMVKAPKQSDFRNSVREIMKKTILENGCSLFQFLRDIEQEERFYLIFRWDSPEKLERYLRSAVFQKGFQKMSTSIFHHEISYKSCIHAGGEELVNWIRNS